jgi:hypothetical protein
MSFAWIPMDPAATVTAFCESASLVSTDDRSVGHSLT